MLYLRRGWYYFKFANEADSHTILHGGPWMFGNSSLILKQWTPDFCAHMDTLKVVPVWTLFTDLDPCFWSPCALSNIASLIGKPLFADPYTMEKSRISFARVLIDIDISKEIPSFVKVNTPYGIKMFTVEYEWMPHFCTHCDTIGHSSGKCRKVKQSDKAGPSVKKIWQPIPKNTPIVTTDVNSEASAKLPAEATGSVAIDSITQPSDDSNLQNEDSHGFKTVKRRSRSHMKTQSVVPVVHNSNSFAALDFNTSENEHSQSMMEGGGAPHSLS